MIMYWRLCRLFFLLVIAAHVSTGFEGGISSFWERKVSRDEALAFFKEMNEEFEGASFKGDTTGKDTASNGASSKVFTKSNVGRASGNATQENAARRNSEESLDKKLRDHNTDLCLATLTGGLFNGANFIAEDDVGHDGTLYVVEGQTKKGDGGVDLPGDLKFDGTITVKFRNQEEWEFKDSEIEMSGTINLGVTGLNAAPIEVKKALDAEVFEITSFAPASQALKVVTFAADIAERIKNAAGVNTHADVLSAFGEELGKISGFGAFDGNSLQLVVKASSDSKISEKIKASSVNVILSYSRGSESTHYSLLIEYTDIKTKIGELSGQSDLFDNNPFIKDIDSNGCIFLVSATTSYFDIIKENTDLTNCFGNQAEEEASEEEGAEKKENPEKAVFMELEAGLHVRLQVDFATTLEACWGEREDKPDFSGIDTNVRVYGKVTKSGLNARLLSEVPMAFKMIKKCAGGLLRDAPAYFTDGQVVLQHFSKTKDDDERVLWKIILYVRPNEGNDFTIPGTTISLMNLEIDAENSYNDEGEQNWDLNANLETKVGEADIVVSYVKEGESVNLQITSSRITISDILNVFNPSAVDQDDILKTLGIKDFKLEKISQGGNTADEYIISGKPIIFGFENLEFSAFLAKPSQESLTYAVGIYLNGADFSPIMSNLLGRDDISLQWLTNLKAVIVFTNYPKNFVLANRGGKKRAVVPDAKKSMIKKQNGTKLSAVLGKKKIVKRDEDEAVSDQRNLEFDDLHESFQGKQIDYTLTFKVSWKIPKKGDEEECFENPLCEWMVTYLSGEDEQPELCIEGEYGDGEVKLQVALTDFRVKFIETEQEELIFNEMKLSTQLGTRKAKVEISAAMTYANTHMGVEKDNPLKFEGLIAATPIQLSLTFSMHGFMKVHQYIQIGDLMLGGGFSGGTPCFVFGGAIKLGDFGEGNAIMDNDNTIEIRGYVSVDIGSPMNNWIYGTINALTVQRVCDAFKLKCEEKGMTDSLLKTGFPNGIIASYSNSARESETYGEIPEGLQIKGTINIFGFECYTELVAKRMQPSGFEFNMTIEMSPLEWGNGMIQVLREEEDQENGPLANVEINSDATSTHFKFEIKGYANLLGVIQAGVHIKVDKSQFSFTFEGYLIPGFVKAEISMIANYGASGSSEAKTDPLFSFTAKVETASLAEALKQEILDYINQLREKVDAAKEYALGKVKEAEDKVNDAEEEVERWKTAIRTWETSLKNKQAELEREKPKPCVCDKVCLPFMDWNPKCWKVWGYWVGCPFWNSCFKMVDDVMCLAGCALQNVVSTLQKWAQQAILKVGQLILGGVQGLLKLADKVFEFARKVLESAKKVVDLIASKICEALTMVGETFEKMLETIQLHMLEVSAALTADYSACVGYTYNITFFEATYEGQGEACLDFASFTKAIVGGVVDGNDKTRGAAKTNDRLKEAGSLQKEVEKAESDLNDVEEDTASKVDADTKEAVIEDKRRSDVPKLEAIASKMEKIPREHKVPTQEEMERIKLTERDLPTYDVRGDSMVRSFVDHSPWNLPMHHLPVGKSQTVLRDHTETLQKRTLDFGSELSPCARMKRALSGYSDLTDGLLEYSNAVAKSNKELGTANLARDEQLGRFRREIDSAVLNHNMTTSEKEDAYYLYHQVSARNEELEKKSMVALHTEDKYAMPIIRRHLNDLLGGEKGSTFMQFTDKMHVNAVQGYKRSKIPTAADVQGEKVLGKIKAELQSIVTAENSALTPMTSRLQSLKKNIVSMSELAKKCDHA